jgi:hypothetical protein
MRSLAPLNAAAATMHEEKAAAASTPTVAFAAVAWLAWRQRFNRLAARRDAGGVEIEVGVRGSPVRRSRTPNTATATVQGEAAAASTATVSHREQRLGSPGANVI